MIGTIIKIKVVVTILFIYVISFQKKARTVAPVLAFNHFYSVQDDIGSSVNVYLVAVFIN